MARLGMNVLTSHNFYSINEELTVTIHAIVVYNWNRDIYIVGSEIKPITNLTLIHEKHEKEIWERYR